MRYTLSSEEEEEIKEQAKRLPKGKSSMQKKTLHVSASKWSNEHLSALRVIYLDHRPLSRFFESQHIVGDADAAFSTMKSEITAATEKDIKQYSDERDQQLSHNTFIDLFRTLSNTVRTRDLDVPGTLDYGKNPTPSGDSSHSSDEDKPEETSRQCLEVLVAAILGATGALYEKYRLACERNALKSTVYLGTQGQIGANTDGGIVLSAFSEHTGSSRRGVHPIVSFEAKRRHAGGVHHSSGEQENFSATVLGQELAELLGQAMTHCKQAEEGWKDQESWCLTIHGTEIRLISALFTQKYLRYVNGPFMYPSERLVVFRSQPFNLKTDEGRVMALKAVLSLLGYLRSGEAKIELLRLVIS